MKNTLPIKTYKTFIFVHNSYSLQSTASANIIWSSASFSSFDLCGTKKIEICYFLETLNKFDSGFGFFIKNKVLIRGVLLYYKPFSPLFMYEVESLDVLLSSSSLRLSLDEAPDNGIWDWYHSRFSSNVSRICCASGYTKSAQVSHKGCTMKSINPT